MIKIEQTNFWEANGFRVDVERIDDNVQQLELLNKFFTDRAEIEGDISLFYSIFYFLISLKLNTRKNSDFGVKNMRQLLLSLQCTGLIKMLAQK